MKKHSFLLACLLSAILVQAHYALAGSDSAKETYSVDTEKSSVKWTGKSIKGGHFGNIRITEGNFVSDGKSITSGNVTIDMNSITVLDLQEASRQERLSNHLKSDDFFSVEKFPEAKLAITGSKPGKAGQIEVTGNLTIKGITKPVTFPVTIKNQGSGLEAEGTITVDRILYDIKYRSKSVLDPSALADRLIYDEFTLDFKVVASK